MSSEKEQALSVVTTSLPIFKAISDLYQKADAIYNQVDNEEHHKKQKASKSFKPGIIKRVVDIGIVFLTIIVGSIGTLFASILPDAIASIIYYIFMGCALIILSTCFWLPKKAERYYRNHMVSSVTIDTTPYEQRLQGISDELVKIASTNQAIIEAVPRDYRYYDAVCYFEKVLVNGQADNMKEAMNLYDNHLHHLKMEENSQRMLKNQQQQARMLADIDYSARSAANNSRVAATFSVLNYLSRL